MNCNIFFVLVSVVLLVSILQNQKEDHKHKKKCTIEGMTNSKKILSKAGVIVVLLLLLAIHVLVFLRLFKLVFGSSDDD